MNDQELKAEAVLTLTEPDDATDRDRDAAKLLSRCEVRALFIDERQDPSIQEAHVDVLIHCTHDLAQEAKRSGGAHRIERALNRVTDTPIRQVQWVEARPTTSTGTGAGAGDGRAPHKGTPKTNKGKEPKPAFDVPGWGAEPDPSGGGSQTNVNT